MVKKLIITISWWVVCCFSSEGICQTHSDPFIDRSTVCVPAAIAGETYSESVVITNIWEKQVELEVHFSSGVFVGELKKNTLEPNESTTLEIQLYASKHGLGPKCSTATVKFFSKDCERRESVVCLSTFVHNETCRTSWCDISDFVSNILELIDHFLVGLKNSNEGSSGKNTD